MTRKVLLALIVTAAAATAAPAQNWAEKMFPDGIEHDFGVVPHGAQLFHRFAVKNIYAVRMEITSITPGCGCVTAKATKRELIGGNSGAPFFGGASYRCNNSGPDASRVASWLNPARCNSKPNSANSSMRSFSGSWLKAWRKTASAFPP